MGRKLKSIKYLLLCLVIFLTYFNKADCALASEPSYIILSHYHKNMDIGDKLYLWAYTSTGRMPSFKSSSPKVASVDRYGVITAKKAGRAIVSAKIKNSTAACVISVNPTEIKLNKYEIFIEHNQDFRLVAKTSNGSDVRWRTSRKSVASVDGNGKVTGGKPGTAMLTASADGYHAVCKVTVKKPVITINRESLSLYPSQKVQLTAHVSSGIAPKWRSGCSKVASVDGDGLVTANKKGTAFITAIVDGVSKKCKVVVVNPGISFTPSKLIQRGGGK